MNEGFVTGGQLTRRRSFLSAALAGGTLALCTGSVSAEAEGLASHSKCGDLSAADPLFLYQSLVWRLYPAAIKVCQQTERKAQNDLSSKLKQLWEVSDRLRTSLSGQSRLEPAVERLNSLAYIGHSHAQAVKTSLKTTSLEAMQAQMKSQDVITAEIVKASIALAQQNEKKLTGEQWDLLQQLLILIDELKTTYHPAFLKARSEYDECLSTASKTIFAIQDALTDASTAVVRGNKKEALRQLTLALTRLNDLADATVPIATAPVDLAASLDADANSEQLPEFLTREQFKAMLMPVKDLISGTKRIPQISTNSQTGFTLSPVAYVSKSEIFFPNGFVDPTSVNQIVKQCFISGHWLQVAAVTAACLPLWSAYGKGEQRKILIHSALCAVPRGKSKLWEAAYYLDNLI